MNPTIYSKNVRLLRANSKTKPPVCTRFWQYWMGPKYKTTYSVKKKFSEGIFIPMRGSIFKPKNEPKLGFAQIKN